MSVIVDEKNRIFILETANTHYVIGVDAAGNAHHIHWGKKCRHDDYVLPDCMDIDLVHMRLDSFKLEYTPFGKTLYRECSAKAQFADDCREINIDYAGCEADENSLTLIFNDVYYPLKICLNYRLFDGSDIIMRSVTVENTGEEEIVFEKLMSAEVNLPGTKPYHIINTLGAWSAEFGRTDTVLEGGSAVYESRRGTSSHNNSPYFIAHRGADEKNGEVYFADLAWSGSFRVEVSRDIFGATRAELGMNSFDFEYALRGGESFTTPEVMLGRACGFGDMSRQLHRFAVAHILPKNFADTTLPVLYNSWEATLFNVNVHDQTELAKKAAAAGCELFVMDDGWFGDRNDDHAGLGDWYPNRDKFPNGLDELIENVNALGLDFGLWVEPEMVNPDSNLFRAHPDWAYHYDTRKANEVRSQLVLNMTRGDVQEYIFNTLNDLLTKHNIKYIKWDMNRPLSETGAENLEHPKMLWYLHVKAVYDIVDRLKALHPEVQFESCSSGGGRCDYGALMHFDQVWTSDNTDSIDRIVLQRDYALTRPAKTMRAWVTDVNWYNRPTPFNFRFNIAMRGVLGLGGDLSKYSDEDITVCRKNVDLYKDIREIVQFGDLYRLLDIDGDEISADIYVNSDKTDAALFIAAVNTRRMKKPIDLYIDGLDDKRLYAFDFDSKHYEKSGAYFRNVGIKLEVTEQYYNRIIRIKAK